MSNSIDQTDSTDSKDFLETPEFKTFEQVCVEIDAHFGSSPGTAMAYLRNAFKLRVPDSRNDLDMAKWNWKPTSATSAYIFVPANQPLTPSKSIHLTSKWPIHVIKFKRIIPESPVKVSIDGLEGDSMPNVGDLLSRVGHEIREDISYAVDLPFSSSNWSAGRYPYSKK